MQGRFKVTNTITTINLDPSVGHSIVNTGRTSGLVSSTGAIFYSINNPNLTATGEERQDAWFLYPNQTHNLRSGASKLYIISDVSDIMIMLSERNNQET